VRCPRRGITVYGFQPLEGVLLTLQSIPEVGPDRFKFATHFSKCLESFVPSLLRIVDILLNFTCPVKGFASFC